MSEVSAYLSLPYILPAQAQKHVTHNAAIEMLDERVQIAVKSNVAADAPGDAVAGERYIVAVPGEGAWLGQDGAIATLQNDGSWRFTAPGAGWIVFVLESSEILGFSGTAWVPVGGGVSSVLGVNATADAVNRLSVSAPATLLNHEGAGHQLKVNKAATAETASLLFQSNFTGHAEFGLMGENRFALKVSADGAAWVTALSGDGAAGAIDGPVELRLQAQTAAELRPATAAGAGAMALVSDGVSGLAYVFSDGVDWRYLADNALV